NSNGRRLLELRRHALDELPDSGRVVEVRIRLQERSQILYGQLWPGAADGRFGILSIRIENPDAQRLAVECPDFGDFESGVNRQAVERTPADVNFNSEVRWMIEQQIKLHFPTDERFVLNPETLVGFKSALD